MDPVTFLWSLAGGEITLGLALFIVGVIASVIRLAVN